MSNDLIGFLVVIGLLLLVLGVARLRRDKKSEVWPAAVPTRARTFLSCTLRGFTLPGLVPEHDDLTVDEARALVMAGVMSGPEFLDEGDEADRYRAEYFGQTVMKTLGIDESTAKDVIRPWEEGTESKIGDRIVFLSIDRGTGDVNLRLVTMVPSKFIG